MRKIRELVFQVGLVLLAIVVGRAMDSPFGYVIAGVLAIGFIAQWMLQREELAGTEETELFQGAIPCEGEGVKEKQRLVFCSFLACHWGITILQLG